MREEIICFENIDNKMMFEKKRISKPNQELQVLVDEYNWAFIVKNGVTREALEPGAYYVFDKLGLLKTRKADASIVDIIFISKTYRLKSYWGTAKRYDFRDSKTNLPYTIGANGTYEIQVANPKKFYLRTVGGSNNLVEEDLVDKLRERISFIIQPIVARVMKETKADYTELIHMEPDMANLIMPELKKVLTEDYGLDLFSFTININIHDEDKKKIESSIKNDAEIREKAADDIRKEQKKKEELEKAAIEMQREQERLEEQKDKEWKRQLELRKMEQEDHNKYLETVAKIGRFENEAKKGSSFCSSCGKEISSTDEFCPGCGMRLKEAKCICPKCKKENDSKAKFCCNCGEKL